MFDSIGFPVTTLLATALSLLLAQVSEQSEWLFLLLLPFIGSMVVAWLTMWFNPSPETRRVTGGRVGFALFFGTLTPSILALIHPGLAGVINIPQVLILLGGIISFGVYILSYQFSLRFYARARADAERLADYASDKFAQKVGVVVADTAAVVAEKLRQEPISDLQAKKVAGEIIAQTTEAIKDSPEAAHVIEIVAESTAKKIDEIRRN